MLEGKTFVIARDLNMVSILKIDGINMVIVQCHSFESTPIKSRQNLFNGDLFAFLTQSNHFHEFYVIKGNCNLLFQLTT